MTSICHQQCDHITLYKGFTSCWGNEQPQGRSQKVYLYEYIYISTTLTRGGNIWNNISTTVCLPIPAKNSISAVQHHPQSSVVNITRGW